MTTKEFIQSLPPREIILPDSFPEPPYPQTLLELLGYVGLGVGLIVVVAVIICTVLYFWATAEGE